MDQYVNVQQFRNEIAKEMAEGFQKNAVGMSVHILVAGMVEMALQRAMAKTPEKYADERKDTKGCCLEFGTAAPAKEYCLDFGEAIRAMKQGLKVARKGWNGKDQYIQLASNISYVTPNGKVVNCEHADIGNKAIAFVGTSGVQMGWLASQADMLAEDWIVVA